jgi:hypothetical protein
MLRGKLCREETLIMEAFTKTTAHAILELDPDDPISAAWAWPYIQSFLASKSKDNDGQLQELIHRYLELRNTVWDIYEMSRFAPPTATTPTESIERRLAVISNRCGYGNEDNLRQWIIEHSK